MGEKFDRDYFENGVQTGKSLYENYRWLPDLTIPMAHFIIMHMGLRPGDTVLDYGCSKGYLVKALRLLGIDAYGCDVSRYAIESADPETQRYCCLMTYPGDPVAFSRPYDAIISKDVLEHLYLNDLDLFLRRSRQSDRALHVIPLGNHAGHYVVPEYERDSTHIIRWTEHAWMDKFEEYGWKMKTFAFSLTGIKDKWTSTYPRGNGFFLLE